MPSSLTTAKDTLDYLLEMQREMSITRAPSETVRAFMELARSVTPSTRLLMLRTVEAPRGDGTTAYNVLFDGAVSEREITDEVVLRLLDPVRPDEPIGRGGFLSTVVELDGPQIFDRLDLDPGDNVIGSAAHAPRSAAAIPLYRDGGIHAWVVSLAEWEAGFDDWHLLQAMVNANMLLRSIAQADVLQRLNRLNRRLTAQFEALGAAQRSLLPAGFPPAPQLAFAASYDPCEAAGGDSYDFTHFPDGRIGLTIADVSGHGPAAAVIMAVMRTTMSAFRIAEYPSRSVVEHVNRGLREAISGGVFVTAYFLSIDPASGECEFANCGHPPPLLRRAGGEVHVIEGDASPPLGVLDDLQSAGGAFRLNSGDTLVLYTDGIVESFNHRNEMFERHRLETAIGSGGEDPAAIIAAIRDAVDRHAEGRKADDDQTLVVTQRLDA